MPFLSSKICGSLEYYDKTYDRLNTKTSISSSRLKRINRVYHKVTTTDDPIIRSVYYYFFKYLNIFLKIKSFICIWFKLAKSEGNVFATDSIISTLMCCSRSVYPWDIVVSVWINKRGFGDLKNIYFFLYRKLEIKYF